ncbi:tripartite motif-containing protein 16-like protein [Conger conger]|uniref:tripartite motif-containing protein 16-like protein n=1 Tax=Conger conger TaxID=82655 RepID=UPI002A5A69A9|nr:tripartite motif-containing protein 16-like protein [Conger conger]
MCSFYQTYSSCGSIDLLFKKHGGSLYNKSPCTLGGVLYEFYELQKVCSLSTVPALLSLASVQHHSSCSCGQNQGVPPSLSHTVSEKTIGGTKRNSALNSRDQEKAEVSRAEGLLERQEQEIAELRRRDAELKHLSHTEDHIHFLQSCQSLCVPPGPGDLPSITVSPHISFEAARKSVSELKERLEDVCQGQLLKMAESVKEVHIVELRTREDFLQYYCHLTLDPNTASNCLYLPEGNREANRLRELQSYPIYLSF